MAGRWRRRGAAVCLALLLPTAATGADDGRVLVFATPPWEQPAGARRLVAPLLALLAQETGRRFEYRHHDTWVGYVREMQADRFDLVFDEPHFIAWRSVHLGHQPLARIRGSTDFVLVARRDDPQIVQLADVAGFTVCGRPPPDLPTLLVLRRFPNPAREPRVLPVAGERERLEALVEGRCRAAAMSRQSYLRLAAGNRAGSRILYHSGAFPRRGFSASGRLPEPLRRRIAAILLSAEGADASRALRERFAGGLDLVAATAEDYRGLESLLDGWWPAVSDGVPAQRAANPAGNHD